MFLCLGSVYSTLFGVYTIKLRAGEGTHPYEMGESSGSAVGADDLGGPRAHSVRPYTEKKGRTVNVLWERESPPPLRGTPL